MLFFRTEAQTTIDIYLFPTCNKLGEYRQRSWEDTRKSKEGAATHHCKSVAKRSSGIEEEDVQQAGEIPMDWGSVVDGQSEGS